MEDTLEQTTGFEFSDGTTQGQVLTNGTAPVTMTDLSGTVDIQGTTYDQGVSASGLYLY